MQGIASIPWFSSTSDFSSGMEAQSKFPVVGVFLRVSPNSYIIALASKKLVCPLLVGMALVLHIHD